QAHRAGGGQHDHDGLRPVRDGGQRIERQGGEPLERVKPAPFLAIFPGTGAHGASYKHAGGPGHGPARGEATYAFNTPIATMASTTATTTTATASRMILRPGAFMFHGCSGSLLWLANARNSAVLLEVSGGESSAPPELGGAAEFWVPMEYSVSRSDMRTPLADHGRKNGPVSAELRESGSRDAQVTPGRGTHRSRGARGHRVRAVHQPGQH